MNVPNFEIKEYSRRAMVLSAKGITYQEFLKSPLWQKTKEMVFKKVGKLCFICESTKQLNVHHNNYNHKNLSGSTQNLVVLCNDCHNEVHKVAKKMGWYYKKVVRSLKKRYKKYGSIYYYPPKSKILSLIYKNHK